MLNEETMGETTTRIESDAFYTVERRRELISEPGLRPSHLFTSRLLLTSAILILTSVLLLARVTNGQLLSEFESSRDPVTDIFSLAQILKRSNENPGSQLTTPSLAKLYGYEVENHKVVTDDGYVLTMHRIPHGKDKSFNENDITDKKRPVVFLQHGLFASSFEWMMNTPDKLLALRLADSGWDVWLGNCRGNAYSRQHLTISPSDKKFWEFSFHEMGLIDLPNEIDYVLNKTGQSRLQYIGFSMGTTMFWSMMSLRPEYNEKVSLMVALAPVVYINNMMGFPRFLAPFHRLIKYLLDVLGNGEFLPPWLLRLYNGIGTKLCSNTWIAESICANINFLYAGWDLPQTQINQLPLFYSHTPSPTATRTLAHVAQLIANGVFAEYDFGYRENIMRYGKSTPPKYNLKNTTTPIALLWGPNDAVVSPLDVRRLASELPNLIFNSPVDFALWNHFDYHLGKDADELVNPIVINLLSTFDKK